MAWGNGISTIRHLTRSYGDIAFQQQGTRKTTGTQAPQLPQMITFRRSADQVSHGFAFNANTKSFCRPRPQVVTSAEHQEECGNRTAGVPSNNFSRSDLKESTTSNSFDQPVPQNVRFCAIRPCSATCPPRDPFWAVDVAPALCLPVSFEAPFGTWAPNEQPKCIFQLRNPSTTRTAQHLWTCQIAVLTLFGHWKMPLGKQNNRASQWNPTVSVLHALRPPETRWAREPKNNTEHTTPFLENHAVWAVVLCTKSTQDTHWDILCTDGIGGHNSPQHASTFF